MKFSVLPWVMYDLSGSDSGPVRPMVTERKPETCGQGLGRYVGSDGVDGLAQLLPETSLDPALGSSTVAEAWPAIKINIISNLFMPPPLNKKRKAAGPFSA
jgi:hypothetical protein